MTMWRQVSAWALCFGLVVAMVGAASAQSPTVRRTTLLVEDLSRSIDFYQRLGMTVWYDKETRDTDEEGVIGARDLPLTADPKRGRIVIMKGSDDRNGMIGLLAYEKPPLASARGNLMGLGVGDVIIMVEVADIGFVYGRLQEAGVRIHSPPSRFEITESDGSIRDRGRRMFAYDPDGRMVEISQPERPR